MKRILLVVLAMVLILIPFSNVYAIEDPVQVVIDSANYINDKTELQVEAHYVNLGNRQVTDVEETTLDVYQGSTLVASGKHLKDVAWEIQFDPGDSEKTKLVIKVVTPVAELKDLTCTSSIRYNTGPIKELPAGKKVYYNGSLITYDVQPAVVNGRLLVPARATFEKMGAKVYWEPEEQKVKVVGNKEITLFINSNIMMVSGDRVMLDTPAQIVDGRTLVPLRAVSTGLNAKVVYGAENEMVVIYAVQ